MSTKTMQTDSKLVISIMVQQTEKNRKQRNSHETIARHLDPFAVCRFRGSSGRSGAG
jgi:hypothetical protein